LGLHRHLKVYMYPGFQEPGSGLALGMNKAWWDRRSPADQAMIRACCAAANDAMRAEYTARDGDSLETLVREHGVELHGFPEPVFTEIAAAAEQVVADTALADDLARRIHASHTAFRSRVAPWSRLSDAAFVTARFTALGI
ncbi:MAG: ABC transporter substrate-binding protein, partial [Thermohalobaculum sp.]|nr:ABC transporter substrate-binding protein [Thermohalobaculum sp.]